MSRASGKHRRAASVEFFDVDDQSYLDWVQSHPEGYIANVDRMVKVPDYPMIHRATHGLLSSAKIGNFTAGDYVKYCSTDLDALRAWVEFVCGRVATRCGQCM